MANTLLDNLIAVWCEAAAPVTDEFDSETLTNNNAVGTGAGVVGTRGIFNGSTQWLSHASDSNLQLGGTDWTLAAWVNSDIIADGFQNFFGKGVWNGASDGEYLFRVNSSQGQLVISDGSSTHVLAAATFGNLSSTTWYYLQAQHVNGTKIRIRVNNGTWDEFTWTTGTRNGTDVFGVGATTGGVGFFRGSINQAAIWKAAKSDADLNAAYNSGSGLAYASWTASGAAAFLAAPPLVVGQSVKRASYY